MAVGPFSVCTTQFALSSDEGVNGKFLAGSCVKVLHYDPRTHGPISITVRPYPDLEILLVVKLKTNSVKHRT